jgi:hypothetical protein
MEKILIRQSKHHRFQRIINEAFRYMETSPDKMVDIKDLSNQLQMKRTTVEGIIGRYNRGEIDRNGAVLVPLKHKC